MRIYRGFRDGRVQVDKDDGYGWRDLPMRLNLRNHSPTGFSWGYGGSGPAQLALAILSDLIGDEAALDSYMRFKFRVIGRLPFQEEWTLNESAVRDALAVIEKER